MRCPGVRSPESRYPGSSPAGHLGFDFVLVDTEHGLAGSSELEHRLRAAGAAGIAALVRVGSNDPLWTLRALDAGATTMLLFNHTTILQQGMRHIAGASDCLPRCFCRVVLGWRNLSAATATIERS